jgi:hypothetical protein
MTVWSTPGESASDYLQDTLGDVLAEILLDCANHRPDNAVAFVASAFERKAKSSHDEDGSEKSSDIVRTPILTSSTSNPRFKHL